MKFFIRGIFAAVLAFTAGVCVVSCKGKPEKVYKPLVPENTSVAVVSYNRYDNPVKKDMDSAIIKIFCDSADWFSKNDPENGKYFEGIKNKLAGYSIEKEFESIFGIPISNFEWSLFTVSNFHPHKLKDLYNKNVEGMSPSDIEGSLPDIGFVMAFKQPVDIKAMAESVRAYNEKSKSLVESMTKAVHADYDTEGMEDLGGVAESVGDYFKSEEIVFNGRPAIRFSIEGEEDLGVKVSPIVASSEDGRLVFVAFKDATVGMLSDLYAGKVPSDTGNMAAEVAVPPDCLSKAVFMLDMKSFSTDLEDIEFGEEILSLSSVSLDEAVNRELREYCLSLKLGFADTAAADTIKNQLDMVIQAVPMMAAFGGMNDGGGSALNSLFSGVMSFLEYIETSIDGNNVVLKVTVPVQDVESFDAGSLLNNYKSWFEVLEEQGFI